uniref:Tripartite motif containing 21 n=1 Tax=Ornithorhynchus anatinus TaxID=9258 RepID=F6VC71_ORNAN
MASEMQVERIGKEMTCPICLEFSGEPMSIKCGHSFCHRCISKLWREGHSSCPECRASFQQEDIRPNRQLGNLVESLKPVVKDLRLFCEKDGKAVCAACHRYWERNGHHADPIEEATETYKVGHLGGGGKVFQGARKNPITLCVLDAVGADLCWIHILNSQVLLVTLPVDCKELQASLQDHEKQSRLWTSPVTEAQRSEVTRPRSHSRRTAVSGLEFRTSLRYIILLLLDPHCPRLPWYLLTLDPSTDPMSLSAADVTLDPNTAHPTLFLKDNQRSVSHADTPQNLPDTIERFDNSFNILGAQHFTKGKHYWEVSVAGKTHWDVGVCRDSVGRKGMVTLCPHTGFWAMILRNANKYQACTSPTTCLSPAVPPQKIGVFLDYEAGNVLFFNITDESHIFTFSGCTFSGPVRPFFSPGPNYKGENLAPLTICLMNGED